MAAVKPPFTSMPGRSFWGLVVQKGPWKSTYSDYLRAHQVPGGAKGGGVPVGGTGEGKRDTVMTPYQQNGRKPLPEPSEHATQSIVRPGESWQMKKPPPGMKQVSKLKAALVIGKTAGRDYEDISHPEGMEPNVPPPPPDLKSTFLTEERLGRSRNKNGLTVVTRNLPRYDVGSSEVVSQGPPSYSTGTPPSYSSSSGRPMSLDTPPASRQPPPLWIHIPTTGGRPSPVSSGGMMSVDTPMTDAMSVDTQPQTLLSATTEVSDFVPPSIDLQESYKSIAERRGAAPVKVQTGYPTLPYSRQGSTVPAGVKRMETKSMPKAFDEFPLNIKRKVELAELSPAAGSKEREKKGKGIVVQKPKEKIITMKEAEMMRKAASAKQGSLKGKFAPSNKKPKRKAEEETTSGREKKGKLAPKEKLKIQVTGLPLSKQSSTVSKEFAPKQKKKEDKSAPKKSDTLPEPRPKRSGVSKKSKKK